MKIKARMKNGSIIPVTIPVPESFGNIGECDYIDNWLCEHYKGDCVGWFRD